MPKLKWGDPSKRFFDTGLDRGVLYPRGTPPAGEIVAKNYLANPRLKNTDGALTTLATNFVTNPSLEVDTSGWAINANCSLARSTAQAYVGSASLAITAVSAATVSVLMQWSTGRARIDPGSTINASVMLKASTIARSVYLVLYWYDSTVGTTQVAGSVTGATVTDTTTGWTRVTVSGVAPQNAASCTVSIVILSPASGEVHYADAGLIMQGPLSDYFDGNTLDDDTYTYDWTGTANASTSTKKAKIPTGITGTSREVSRNLALDPALESSSNYGVSASGEYPVTIDTSVKHTGTRSMRVDRANTTLNNEIGQVNMTPRLVSAPDRVIVAPGDIISASVRIRNGVSGGRAHCDIYFFDSSSNAVGSFVGAYVNTGQNVWTDVKNENVIAPAGSAYVMVRGVASLPSGQTAVGGEQSWFDSVIVVKAATVPSYFDGNNPASDKYSYSWVGTANASVSIKTSIERPWIDAAVLSPTTGDPSARMECNGLYTAQGFYTRLDVIAELLAGSTFGARVRVKAPFGFKYSVIATSTGTGNIPKYLYLTGSGNWQNIIVSGAVLGANQNPYLVVRSDGAQTGTFWVTDAMIFTGMEAPPYFDGDTVDDEVHTYAWSGTVNNSISTKTENSSLAVPWDGLTSVDENGADSAVAYYIDGRPFLFLPKPKEYAATLKAITYPDEFAAIMGLVEATDGMYLDSQQPDAFDMCYRTKVGDGVSGEEAGYKIHLVYNATVAPAGNSYQSLGGAINPLEFSWEIQAVPVPVTGYRPTAHIIIDTRHMDSTKLAAIEGMLYGDDTHLPSMRDPQVILDLLSYGDTIIINDLGNGEWEAVGSYKNIYLIGDGVFEIDNVNAVDHGDGTYTVSSTP